MDNFFLKKTTSNRLKAVTAIAAMRFLTIGGILMVGAVVNAQEKPTIVLPQNLKAEQISQGWISLFDGESLFGWTAVTDADWTVSEGTISVRSGQRGLLRTTAQFDDYELTLEFKADTETNSGVFLRTSPKPTNVTRDCYELNIAPADNKFPTGSLVGRIKSDDVVHKNDVWHRYRIIANGPKIKVWLDDVEVIEYDDESPAGRGYIGLQYNAGKIAFKNIFLRPLNQENLLADSTLNQWKTDQKLESKFKVTNDGELEILGGKGQIESKRKYGDFIFSMKCKTNADGLNSGVFFRCIPGDLMNGYESQIQNQFKGNDRTQPVDCGTGGIFRRTLARRVNADDQQWFSKTIVASGPHISVWVNGLQVTDWSDERKKDLNPRRGLRLEPGTIIFQGHDPTTDILIKDVMAKEIAPRRPKKSKQ